MSFQLHRKQLAVLTFAAVLAAASYWIPAPEQATPTSSVPALHQKTTV